KIISSVPVPLPAGGRPLLDGTAYRCAGGIFRIAAENSLWATTSTGRCLVFVLAGSMPRKLFPFQLVAGRIGRGTNPPPQLGQTLPRTVSTQLAQNMHS